MELPLGWEFRNPCPTVAEGLLKLSGFTSDMRYVDIGHRAFNQMQAMMSQDRLGFGQWLQAISFTPWQPVKIAIRP